MPDLPELETDPFLTDPNHRALIGHILPYAQESNAVQLEDGVDPMLAAEGDPSVRLALSAFPPERQGVIFGQAAERAINLAWEMDRASDWSLANE